MASLPDKRRTVGSVWHFKQGPTHLVTMPDYLSEARFLVQLCNGASFSQSGQYFEVFWWKYDEN